MNEHAQSCGCDAGSAVVYLASPYSHPDVQVRDARFHAVCRVAAMLSAAGVLVYAPIAHGHAIALAGQLPTDFAYWEALDRAMLAACGRVVVVTLPGWENSVGVQAEIRIATAMGLPIRYLHVEA